MKRFCAIFITLLISHLSQAGININADTAKKTVDKSINAAGEFEPEYPGGAGAFEKYISRHLHYPDAARLLGINGNVYVSFVIDRDGKVTEVTPVNCIGAGCESEAVKVVKRCKPWKPGLQNGRAASVHYTIPINFRMETGRVYMDNLAASDYGFIFKIRGVLYNVDEAEDILGKTISPNKIESAELFYDYDTLKKLRIRNKKEVYLLILKS
jgi:protein TonB